MRVCMYVWYPPPPPLHKLCPVQVVPNRCLVVASLGKASPFVFLYFWLPRLLSLEF